MFPPPNVGEPAEPGDLGDCKLSTATKRFVVIFAVLALLVGACGDDDDTAGEEAGPVTDQDGDGGGAGDDDGSGEEPVAITVTGDGIDAPAEVAGGSSR